MNGSTFSAFDSGHEAYHLSSFLIDDGYLPLDVDVTPGIEDFDDYLNHQKISANPPIETLSHLGDSNWPANNYSGFNYFPTVNTSNTSRRSLSESSVSTSNPPNDGDDNEFDSQENDTGRTFCNVEGCITSFARKTDLNRHKKQKHESNSVYHVCGCCMGSEKPMEWVRKDKLKDHKQKKHGCAKENSLSLCPHQHAGGKQFVWFCSKAALDSHLHLEHGDDSAESRFENRFETVGPGQIGRVVDAPPGCADSVSQGYSNVGSANQLQNTKRPISPKSEATAAIKRTKLANCHGEGSSLEADLRGAFLEFDNALKICCHSDTSIELAVPNVRPAEFLRLFKLGVLPGNLLDIRFDKSKSSVNLKGLPPRVRALKAVLQVVLNASASTEVIKNMLPSSMRPDAPLSNYQDLETNLTDEFAKGPKIPYIFPMNSETDASLVQRWHKEVVPFIMDLLDKYLGNCYTASLVRQGASERTSKVVVRIQCQRIPSSNTQSKIQVQVGEKFGTNSAVEPIQVMFSKRELVYLTGVYDVEEEEEEEALQFPNYQLYWKKPGMGASVGMLTDDKKTATLGCWIYIEKEIHLLTVRHFINPKVLMDSADKKTPCLQVTSPSLGVLENLKGDLGQFQRDNEAEISDEIERMIPEGGSLNLADAYKSKALDKLHLQNEKILKHLKECDMDIQNYIIGTVKLWNDSNIRQPLSPRNSDYGVTMDWAACKAGKRVGANRHRYRYRYEGPAYEGVYWDDDEGRGAGDIVHGVAPIAGNDEVYYVGQASGRMDGILNMANTVLNRNGVKSLEWIFIPSDKQQKEAEKYCGDSGAAIIRKSDNAVVGHLWGAMGKFLLVTPMEDVFADIKAIAGTDNVCLVTDPPGPDPDSPVPLTEYTLTCSCKSKIPLRNRKRRTNLLSIPLPPTTAHRPLPATSKTPCLLSPSTAEQLISTSKSIRGSRKQIPLRNQKRRANLSSIPLRPKTAPPPLSATSKIPCLFSPSTAEQLTSTSKSIRESQKRQLDSLDTFVKTLPSAIDIPSFVSGLHIGDVNQTALPLIVALFKVPSLVKQGGIFYEILSAAISKNPHLLVGSTGAYPDAHVTIPKRPEIHQRLLTAGY